jgi:hypothetical protein
VTYSVLRSQKSPFEKVFDGTRRAFSKDSPFKIQKKGAETKAF